MNRGDLLVVHLHDSPNGLVTEIRDLTSHTTGYMTASAANGFASTNQVTCAGTPYSFHPEYNTAAAVNIVPWAALQLGVSLDIETGHYEAADGDADDTYCGTTPAGQASCLSTDSDFDGTPYSPTGWPAHPNATALHPSPVNLLPLVPHFFGPESNGTGYPIFEFETDIGFTVNSTTTCNLLLPNQCGLPNSTLIPTYGGFYPFFSTMGCQVMFGHVHGAGINTWGGDKQYGSSQAVYSGTLAIWGTNGAFYPNHC
jgi:hypothetical protein